jgi:hypothetical protein
MNALEDHHRAADRAAGAGLLILVLPVSAANRAWARGGTIGANDPEPTSSLAYWEAK